jgi:hypothetical protein
MLRDRASDANDKGVLGNGNRAGIGVSDTPQNHAIFLDDSQAPHVSEDEVQDRRPEMVEEEGDIIEGVESDRGSQAGRGRKRIVGAALGLVALVVAVVVIWLMVGNGGTRKARVPVNAGNSTSAQQSEEGMTRQAIQELNSGPGVTFGDGSVARPQPSPAGDHLVTQSACNEPVTQLPPTVNPNLSSTVDQARSINSSTQASDSNSQSSSVSKVVSGPERNNERSVHIEDLVAPVKREVTSPERTNGGESNAGAVALPSFGSMLPVRSLGVIYTLRAGGLVRLELTRDVKGKGWSLPHGTVLVGALRGSEYGRAFISLIGFIDSESGRFIKITGDVLGSDGGMGVRGKRRKMSSGWSKVLGKLGEASLSIAGSLASSVGRRPVIITDAFGGAGSRVTSEFDGVLFNKDRNVFVEVAAGTSCYVMITELPEAIQGVDALTKFSSRDVESRADSDQRREATGISEHELAELIQSGDPERIKLALPRMTPDMRRLAEAVMSQSHDR